MKNLLKYLIPVLVFAAFSYAAGGFDPVSQETLCTDRSVDDFTSAGVFSVSDSELGVPAQASLTCSARLQTGARRTSTAHRSVTELVKAGKALNMAVLYAVQMHSVTVNVSIVEHAHKLVYLGKLII